MTKVNKNLRRRLINDELGSRQESIESGEKVQKKGRTFQEPGLRKSNYLKPLSLHCHVLLDHARDRFFTRRADKALDFFSIAEKNQCRNTLDPIALCG